MCEHGDTVELPVRIPAGLSHTGHSRKAVKPIDRCIAPLVEALQPIGTAGSCCGHGKGPGSIALADGRELWITHPASAT